MGTNPEDLFQVSYMTLPNTQTTTTSNTSDMSYAIGTVNPFIPQAFNFKADSQMRKMQEITHDSPPERRPNPPMARVIRYTVVDPDPVLADKSPELSILLGGTMVLNGTDDKGFLMDLAPKVAERLVIHNPKREEVEYEDKEGKTKKLKAVRLSNLDVIIEVLKSY